ncbi:unnamed protein product [Acanthoscelides obtectus]|uniref:Uncharacterized protein n=1 Tax=Acanthoscelides obtectus TaxID=200917 RepID=A0A9P0NZR4_ACAOB|nr:unnamed protein product [Acanthoscelides obtectus]CAK1638109.1 hypothetical protein AOBTE_LOCUS10392 [Acanthoscelides obtectus]
MVRKVQMLTLNTEHNKKTSPTSPSRQYVAVIKDVQKVCSHVTIQSSMKKDVNTETSSTRMIAKGGNMAVTLGEIAAMNY